MNYNIGVSNVIPIGGPSSPIASTSAGYDAVKASPIPSAVPVVTAVDVQPLPSAVPVVSVVPQQPYAANYHPVSVEQKIGAEAINRSSDLIV